MNKIWWLFGILAMVAVLFNPYASIDLLAILMIIIVNAIFLTAGKVGKSVRHTNKFSGFISQAHSLAFWAWAGFDILCFFMLVYVMYMQTYAPGASPLFFTYGTRGSVLLSFAATTLLQAVCTFFLVRRLHNIFWKSRG